MNQLKFGEMTRSKCDHGVVAQSGGQDTQKTKKSSNWEIMVL